MIFSSSRRVPNGLWSGILVAVFVCAIDQLSKYLVMVRMNLGETIPVLGLPFLSLTRHENFGTAMNIIGNLGELGRVLIICFSLLATAVLCWMMARASSALHALPFALICGGAVGNVIDRIRLGYVVDFVHFHAGGWNFYIFNVADAAITIGVVFLLLFARPSNRR